MANKHFCQSCSMPMDSPELFGTEKNGAKNSDYCKYCYSDGAFTNPGLTLEEMKLHMMKRLGKDKLPEHIIEVAISRLPYLKRWSGSKVTLL
ncbi:hypothetical protein FAM09_13610 [Niastella caeni]|uniref:Putative zinc ribbon domain-containing protein n=1 Tax=Niastella caeni TaxID=2569763 RepID=A0A4V4H192_9BACT|nr:zinc ribbon domain-containing protein [Niastella caeni]THU39536.1 hypothetical protein FAM09_13610 [Niastella caeni]